jgi:hypothetical protein
MAIITDAMKASLQSVYISYFNRPADPDGYSFYLKGITDRLDARDSFQHIIETIATNFSNSPEAQSEYAFIKNPLSASPEQFLLDVYKNAFNRVEPTTTEGFKFWMGRLTDPVNPLEPGLALLKIMAGAEARGADWVILENKQIVAQDYTRKASNDTSFTIDDAGKVAAKALIASVDGTDASVIAGINQVDSILEGTGTETSSGTFALTSGSPSEDLYGQDIVLDFSSTNDTLAFVGGGVGSATNYYEVVGGTGYASALLAANTVLLADAALRYVAVDASDGNIYVFFDANGDQTIDANGVDSSVQLTGLVNNTFIEFGDIIAG